MFPNLFISGLITESHAVSRHQEAGSSKHTTGIPKGMGDVKCSSLPWMGCFRCLYTARSVLGVNATRDPVPGEADIDAEKPAPGFTSCSGWVDHSWEHPQGWGVAPVSPQRREEQQQSWTSIWSSTFQGATPALLHLFPFGGRRSAFLLFQDQGNTSRSCRWQEKNKRDFPRAGVGIPSAETCVLQPAYPAEGNKAQGLGSTLDTPSVLRALPREGLEPANLLIKCAPIGHPQGPSMRHHVMQNRGRLFAPKVRPGSLGGLGTQAQGPAPGAPAAFRGSAPASHRAHSHQIPSFQAPRTAPRPKLLLHSRLPRVLGNQRRCRARGRFLAAEILVGARLLLLGWVCIIPITLRRESRAGPPAAGASGSKRTLPLRAPSPCCPSPGHRSQSSPPAAPQHSLPACLLSSVGLCPPLLEEGWLIWRAKYPLCPPGTGFGICC